MIEYTCTGSEKQDMKEELEATLGLQLEHPNVVRTHKYTMRQTHAVRSKAPSASSINNT